jgi:hypothetical protein
VCRNHDFGIRRFWFKASHTLTRFPDVSTPMFHSRRLPAPNRHQRITPEGAYPRFLTAIKGTPTPIYVLELSSDPPIRRCHRFQVSPQRPDAFLRPQQPTRAVSVTPFLFRTSRSPDLHRFTHQQGLSALPQFPFPCRPTPARRRSGSKGTCLPPAPVSAAPASVTRHAAKAVYERMASSRMSFDVCVFCSWRSARRALQEGA